MSYKQLSAVHLINSETLKFHIMFLVMRPVQFYLNLGNTKVLVFSNACKLGVPPFLKGTKTGWLTAEYAMLPTSCQTDLFVKVHPSKTK